MCSAGATGVGRSRVLAQFYSCRITLSRHLGRASEPWQLERRALLVLANKVSDVRALAKQRLRKNSSVLISDQYRTLQLFGVKSIDEKRPVRYVLPD